MAVLLIGSTGSGKSTLGNFLLDPDNKCPDQHFKVGTDKLPTTSQTELKTRLVEYQYPPPGDSSDADNDDSYDPLLVEAIEVTGSISSLEQDDLRNPWAAEVHPKAGAQSCVSSLTQLTCYGDISSPEKSVESSYFRKKVEKGLQKFKKLTTQSIPRQFRLTVIDTPGLNESPEKDLEHMIDLVEKLQEQETIKACIFVVNFKSQIDQQYRDTIRYYSRLQPSLFGHNSIIVMTEYATDKKSIRKRKKQGIQDEIIISNVKKEIMKSSGMCYEPIVFALDCVPDDEDEEEMATAKSQRDSLLSCIASQREVSTKDIMVAKTKFLWDDDEKTINIYEGEISGYNKRLIQANQASEAILTEVQRKKQDISSIDRNIELLREELQLKDSEELTTAVVWTIDSTWKWFRWQSEQFDIHSDWEVAEVTKWHNGWSSWKDVHQEPRRVHGVIQSHFMRGIYARVSLETKMSTKHAEEIVELNGEIGRKTEARSEIAEELQRKVDEHKDTHNTIELLQTFIDEKRESIQKLGGKMMTLEQARNRLGGLRAKLAAAK